jgi:catechol 1,2-dioxygenase
MNESIARTEELERLLDKVSGQESGKGNPRMKQLVRRIVSDLYRVIDDLDVQPEEYWAALSLLAEAGHSRELGLLSAGLGFDHFLDLRMDAQDREEGVASGTVRTIEGPLYVAGAPMSKGEARLDDGSERGEPVLMRGRVLDANGRPIAGAIVDVWQANSLGNYSFFDRSQAPYNLRRRIETGSDGGYRFRSILPAGYGVPPGGATDDLLKQLGRHGQRPAHIHFFVSARGHRHLTTQINIAGDPHLHDDFAFATRDELIPELVRKSDPDELERNGMDVPYVEIGFDFVLQPAAFEDEERLLPRDRVSAQVDLH